MPDTKAIQGMQGMILEELKALREDSRDTRERVIRVEEKVVAVVNGMNVHISECEVYRAKHANDHDALDVRVTMTTNLANSHERDIDDIKKAKASLWDKVWQFLLMLGGAFAAAWAAVKVGEK